MDTDKWPADTKTIFTALGKLAPEDVTVEIQEDERVLCLKVPFKSFPKLEAIRALARLEALLSSEYASFQEIEERQMRKDV